MTRTPFNAAKGLTIHPARYPRGLPEFFIQILTDEYDVVLDPTAGSNTTGAVAESLRRRWIAFEAIEEYLEGSKYRFFAWEKTGRGRPRPVNAPREIRTADQPRNSAGLIASYLLR